MEAPFGENWYTSNLYPTQPRPPLARIISGGQSGVDRAALDAAMAAHYPVGGWCPQGRRAEDGAIPPIYPLRETPSAEYAQRTLWNVRDSDATLVLTPGPITGGTRWTVVKAQELQRPVLVITAGVEVAMVRAWLGEHQVRVLNVAGPRESEVPGIYDAARHFMQALLQALREDAPEDPAR